MKEKVKKDLVYFLEKYIRGDVSPERIEDWLESILNKTSELAKEEEREAIRKACNNPKFFTCNSAIDAYIESINGELCNLCEKNPCNKSTTGCPDYVDPEETTFYKKKFKSNDKLYIPVETNVAELVGIGEPTRVYDKKEILEMIGTDDKHQGDCDEEGTFTCECGRTRANRMKQEIINKL